MATNDGKGGGGQQLDPETLKTVKDLTQQIATHVGETTDDFRQQAQIMAGLSASFKKMAEGAAGTATGMQSMSAENIQKISEEAKKAAANMDDFDKGLKKATDALGGKFMKAATTAAGALTGLRQGFKNLYAILKSGTGIFSSVVGGLFSIGKAIIGIPLGIFKKFVDMADAGGGGNELFTAYEKVRETFGAFSSVSSKAIISTSKNMMGMSEGGLHSMSVFGNLAEIMTKVTAVAQAMGPQFAKNADEFMKNGKAILYYQKGLGISDDMMGAIAIKAGMMGETITKQLNDMTKQSYALAKGFGLDAKVISRDMGKALQDLAHFGHLSQKELGIAAAYSNKLGISVDKLTSLMDKFSTFDAAAESAANLGEQFGVNVDAMALMSEQNPAKKLDLLRKAFMDTGKDLSKLTFQERQFIQQQTGMDAATFDAAMSQKNATVSLDKMTSAAEKAETAQLNQTAAMKQLAAATERIAQQGSNAKGFFGKLVDGFKQGVENSKEFKQVMENIKKEFVDITTFGKKMGATFVESFPGVKKLLEGAAAVFNPKSLKTTTDKVTELFNKFTAKEGGVLGNFKEFMSGKGGLKEIFLDFFDKSTPAGKQFLEGLGEFWQTVLKLMGEGVKWVIQEVAVILKKVLDFLKDPKMPEVGGVDTKPWMKPFLDIFEVLKKDLLPVLKDFASFLWDKLKEAATSPTGLKVIGGALAIVLGPAILGGIAAGLSSGLMSAGIKGIADGLSGKGGGKSPLTDAVAAGQKASAAAPTATASATQVSQQVQQMSSAVPDKDGTQKLQEAGKTKIDWPSVKNFLLGLAGVMAIGLASFYAALQIVKGEKAADVALAAVAFKAIAMTMPPLVSMAEEMQKAKGLDLKTIGMTLAAIAPIIGVGLLAFLGALKLVKGYKAGDILSAAFLLGAMVPILGGALLLAEAASKLKVDPASTLVGLLAAGAVVAAAAGVGFLAIKALGGFKMSQVAVTVAAMAGMELLFLGAGLLALAAAGLGAAVIGTGGFGGAALIVGLEAAALVILAAALAAYSTVKLLGKFKMSQVSVTIAAMAGMELLFAGAAALVVALTAAGFVGAVGWLGLMAGLGASATLLDYIADTSVRLMKKFKSIEFESITKMQIIMSTMSELFGEAMKMIVELELIGLATLTLVGAASLVTGAAVVEKVIDKMTTTAVDVMKELNKVKGNPEEIKTKAESFAMIIKSITEMASTIGDVASKFDSGGVTGLISNMLDGLFKRKNPVNELIDTLIQGKDGKGGIKSIVEAVGNAVKDVPQGSLDKGKAVAEILGALGNLLKSLAGPAESVLKEAPSWRDFGDKKRRALEDAMGNMTNLLTAVLEQSGKLITGIVDTLSGVDDAGLKALKEGGPAIGGILSAIGQLLNAVKAPDIKVEGGMTSNVGTGNITNIIDVKVPTITSMLEGLQEKLPGLVNAVVNSAKLVPADEEFKKKIETLKTMFEAFEPITSMVQSMVESSKDKDKIQDKPVQEMLAKLQGFFWTIREGGKGGDGAIRNVMGHINDIYNDVKGYDVKLQEKTLSGAVDAIKDIGSMMGEIDVDIDEKELLTSMLSLNDGLVAFETVLPTLGKTLDSLLKTMGIGERGGSIFDSFKLFQDSFGGFDPKSTISAFSDMGDTLDAAQKMIEKVNELNDTLADEGGNTIKITSILDSLSRNLGLGGGGKYTIKNRDVSIKVDLKVVMEAGKVESVILQRADSVIRDKINALVGRDKQEITDELDDDAYVKYTGPSTYRSAKFDR